MGSQPPDPKPLQSRFDYVRTYFNGWRLFVVLTCWTGFTLFTGATGQLAGLKPFHYLDQLNGDFDQIKSYLIPTDTQFPQTAFGIGVQPQSPVELRLRFQKLPGQSGSFRIYNYENPAITNSIELFDTAHPRRPALAYENFFSEWDKPISLDPVSSATEFDIVYKVRSTRGGIIMDRFEIETDLIGYSIYYLKWSVFIVLSLVPALFIFRRHPKIILLIIASGSTIQVLWFALHLSPGSLFLVTFITASIIGARNFQREASDAAET